MADQCNGRIVLATTIALMILMDVAPIGEGFVVAVYEHLDPTQRDAEKPLDEIMLESVAKYEEQARRASQQEVHLLVYPEYGITGLQLPFTRQAIRPYLQVIPHLKVDRSQQWIPCLETDTGFNVTVIHRLSCAARKTGVILVVNIGTILACLHTDDGAPHSMVVPCPDDGAFHFNTDIVFDSNGTVLALYHKINLYLESLFDRPPYASTDVGITFTTSEATFGLITCFDIVWNHPLVTLVRQDGVRHIIQSSAWSDGLPFLTSVQSQMAIAIGLNVTLLAANLRIFPGYRGGSGVYSGHQGILNYTYGTPSTEEGLLIVAAIEPNISKQLKQASHFRSTQIHYEGIIYDNLSGYTLREIGAADGLLSGNISASSGTLTCNVRYEFEAETSTADTGRYYLAVYQGTLPLGDETYGIAIENCAVLWCADRHQPLTTCARPPVNSYQVRLTYLELDSTFKTSYLYPSMLDYDLQPIDTSEWTFRKWTSGVHSNKATVQMATNKDFLYRPLVAALFGRNYDEDDQIVNIM